MRGIEGKKVLITGAASGIGRATAQRFYEEGAHLLLVDLHRDSGLLKEFPLRTQCLWADVSSDEGIRLITDWVGAHEIDVLINNAGITRDAKLEKMTMDQWHAVLDVNLTAVFRLCQLVAESMKARGGVILNAASVVAHYGNYGQANYAASKAGVIALTKTLAKELGRYNIRINAVAPGFIETPMVAKVPAKVLEMIRRKPALARLGQARDVAGVYAFLASDDAAYITGTVINVDGGIILG